MSVQRKLKQRVRRRTLRVRSKLRQKTLLPRVSVFRSLQHISAQIIDDSMHATVVSCSSQELENVSGAKKDVARAVGLELAKKARNKGIEQAVFDRGPFLYHGRVKALVEGLREGGLQL